MVTNIAIAGGGPSAMYVLENLAGLASERFPWLPSEIVVVEAGGRFGLGMPYHPDINLPIHNLAANQEIGRLEKGKVLEDGFHAAVAALRAAGVEVRLVPNTRVTDLERRPGGGFALSLSTGEKVAAAFMVLATGHWDVRADRARSPFELASPWPASALQAAAAEGGHVAILGTSLTAADAAITIALGAGEFAGEVGALTYRQRAGRPLRMTLLSRGGWLPAVAGYGITSGFGDPAGRERYDRHFTEAALSELARRGGGVVRWRDVFGLLRADFLEAGALPRQLSLPADAGDALAALAQLLGRHTRPEGFLNSTRAAAASIRERQFFPWQALLWQKTDLLSACHELYPAEDRWLLDRHASAALALQRPINFANADRLAALARAGCLELRRLGQRYSIAPDFGGGGRPRIEYWDETGRPIELQVDLLVRAIGQSWDIADAEDPLLRRLLERGIARPRAIAFLDPGAARSLAASDEAPRLLHACGEPRYHAGGIDVDGETLEVRSAETDARAEGDVPEPMGIFAMGPLILGQTPYNDGLHVLAKSAPRIVKEIVARLSAATDAEY
jgi:hypothetical protein